ncbi:MAG: transglutaminase-like domain-containing protein [Bacteroidota bacterium]|jgi:hypothetical protein
MRFREQIFTDAAALDETLRALKIMYLENLQNQFFIHWCYANFGFFENVMDLYAAVYKYVRDNFIYKEDPANDELLIAPKYMVQIKTGDCDDFALFIKTVLGVYGVKANYLLAGKTAEGYTHIAVITPEGVIIDGTNEVFNDLPSDYLFRRIVQ